MSSNGHANRIIGRQLAYSRHGKSATPHQISQCEHEVWEAEQLGDELTVAGPVLTTLATVTPRPVDWLWLNRIPRGKTTLVYGDPGLGKSFLTGADFAARVSRGLPWPDGSPCERGDVILWTERMISRTR
jgi:hypothetical protein